MKTIVKTFIAIALIATSTVSMAASKPKKESFKLTSAEQAISAYVEMTTLGKANGAEDLFADDFKMSTKNGNQKSFGRNEMVSFVKKQKGEALNCATTVEIIEESKDYAVAKVILKFQDFTKTDLVTLMNENGTWKIMSSKHLYK